LWRERKAAICEKIFVFYVCIFTRIKKREREALSAHGLVFPQVIGHGSAGRMSLSGHHRAQGNGEDALLGRMGQILFILGSVVNRKSLATWQSDTAASTS
jgi:hypothetical protein